MIVRLFNRRWEVAEIAAVVLIVLATAFGGASRLNVLRVSVVELAALPLLVMGISRFISDGTWRRHKLVLGLAAGIALIPLLQVIPLPPAVWTGLPGRADMVTALELAGVAPGWSPLSLTPDLTWTAFLALIPPMAILIYGLTASHQTLTRLVILFLFATFISILLGAAQLASGTERLYPWETSEAHTMSGLFANRNHLATMMLAALPFAAVLAGAPLRRDDGDKLPVWLGGLFIALVIISLAAARSRAGIVLFAPAALTSVVALWMATGRSRPSLALLGVLGAGAAALVVAAVFALPPILARFEDSSAPEGRLEAWPTVVEAADTYLPLGSGIGSFDAVYRSVEPLERLVPVFFNHAHNEYLETWLEAGWLGAALVIIFLVWFTRRSWSAWTARVSRERDLQRAASVAIGVMALHSVVDYPLRTLTLACMLALCTVILERAGQLLERET